MIYKEPCFIGDCQWVIEVGGIGFQAATLAKYLIELPPDYRVEVTEVEAKQMWGNALGLHLGQKQASTFAEFAELNRGRGQYIYACPFHVPYLVHERFVRGLTL